MAEKKVEGLQSSPREASAADWLYTEDGGALGCKPFIVGTAKVKIYGSIPQLVSRSGFFTALASDLKSLKEISGANPFALLADDVRFNQGVLESFKIVWNYINGVYPDLVLKENPEFTVPVAAWPQEGMSIEEKYRVLYFCDYFGVPAGTVGNFLEEYLRLVVTDLESELKRVVESYAALAGSQAQQVAGQEYNKLTGMALGLRNLILRAPPKEDDYLRLLATYMPPEQKQEMLYGKRDSKIPAAYREIYPDANGMFTYQQLSEAKDLTVQLYRFGKLVTTLKIAKVEMMTVRDAYSSPDFTFGQSMRAISGENLFWPPNTQPELVRIIVLTRADGKRIVQFVSSYHVTAEWLTPGFDDPRLSNQQMNMRAFSA